MSELSFLFTNYSVGELFLVTFVALIAFRVIFELFRYFYDRAKSYFGLQNKKQNWEEKTTESLANINIKIDNMQDSAETRAQRLIKLEESLEKLENQLETLENYSEKTHEQQKDLEKNLRLVQERLQENTRSFLIDAHHRFCYDVKGIDDQNLQSMERRYLYYKNAGGNSFIDELMREVRELPRINYITVKEKLNFKDGREIND